MKAGQTRFYCISITYPFVLFVTFFELLLYLALSLMALMSGNYQSYSVFVNSSFRFLIKLGLYVVPHKVIHATSDSILLLSTGILIVYLS